MASKDAQTKDVAQPPIHSRKGLSVLPPGSSDQKGHTRARPRSVRMNVATRGEDNGRKLRKLLRNAERREEMIPLALSVLLASADLPV